jgi:FKBP-type peptidyl-prolyl cis-trans isomerase FkpA
MAKNQHGRMFDSSLGPGRQPLDFPLGAGKVIKGWDQGVVGMKVGGKRTLIIPSDLAYGKRGAGDGAIPPDSDLIFDVELLDVK